MNSQQTFELKKIVWSYMIERGRETNGEWSYYGGNWCAADPKKEYDWRWQEKRRPVIKNLIKNTGVDWEKTSVPKAVMQSSFEGTFCDSSRCEALIGDLVLKDGTTLKIGVDKSETRFQNYIETLHSFMEDKSRVSEIFGED